jgi:hypothetical protein
VTARALAQVRQRVEAIETAGIDAAAVADFILVDPQCAFLRRGVPWLAVAARRAVQELRQLDRTLEAVLDQLDRIEHPAGPGTNPPGPFPSLHDPKGHF